MSGDTDIELDDAWTAALRGDREAFQTTVRPYLDELLGTACHEVRYRVALGHALGHFAADDPTPEALVGEVPRPSVARKAESAAFFATEGLAFGTLISCRP